MRYYSTTFGGGSENPISEGGSWLGRGLTEGLDWTNVRIDGTLGIAYGTQTGSGGFDDSIAVLGGTWTANQVAWARVRNVSKNDLQNREVELLLNYSISGHNAHGYEFNFSCKNTSTYAQLIRWNGTKGDFVELAANEAFTGINDGDVIMAMHIGSMIYSFCNGVVLIAYNTATGGDGAGGGPDSVIYTDGSPGIANFTDGGSASSTDYGHYDFTAYDAPFVAVSTAALGRTGNGALSVSFPTGYTATAGDFGVIILYSDQGSGSVPTGWTEIAGSPFGAGTEKFQVFTKTLAGADATPSTTISGSTTNISHCAGMLVSRSHTSVGAIGTPSNGTGTPMTAGAITTTAAGSMVLGLCGRGDDEAASAQSLNASFAGVGEYLDQGTTQGNDSQVSAYAQYVASSGTSSGSGSAVTSATDPWVSVQIELKLAAVAGGRTTKNIRAFPLGSCLGMGLGIGGGH